MSGNKAYRRASQTKDAARLTVDLPLIVDTTELITPEKAEEILKHNPTPNTLRWKQALPGRSVFSREMSGPRRTSWVQSSRRITRWRCC